MPATEKAALAGEAERILAYFESRGGQRVEVDILQPAAQLLDLYGEDIRSRAYVTRDAARGELMLRPDFTVPVASHHMQSATARARYTYCGPVFRKQRTSPTRPSEFLQAGFEIFGDANLEATDAEIFRIFQELLAPFDVEAATGDLGILLAAVEGLSISAGRKSALLRHVWRPRRFLQLIKAFGESRQHSGGKQELLRAAAAGDDLQRLVSMAGDEFGTRSAAEVIERIKALTRDAGEEPLSVRQQQCIDEVLGLAGPITSIPVQLKRLSAWLPGLDQAAARIEARIDALNDQGCDPGRLGFEASYGRTTLEYYDGFVFGFFAAGDRVQVASGGRYDFLNEVLGAGRKCPAIGGVVRPEALVAAGRRRS